MTRVGEFMDWRSFSRIPGVSEAIANGRKRERERKREITGRRVGLLGRMIGKGRVKNRKGRIKPLRHSNSKAR